MRGKAFPVTREHAREWDHPRLCGEKVSVTMRKLLGLGSPPPMRGKGNSAVKAFQKFRITPAYAGKSRGHEMC